MYLILIFLLTSSAFAADLEVKYGLYSYTLNLEAKQLHLQGKGIDLSIQKNDCNKMFVSRFEKEVTMAIKRMSIYKQEEPEAVLVSSGNVKSYLPRFTPQGKYFLSLPEEFKKVKIRDGLSCSSKVHKAK